MKGFIQRLMAVFFATCLLLGCQPYKNVAYFKNITDTSRLAVATANYHPLLVQEGDMLAINVMTIDPAANAIFNQAAGSALSSQLIPGSSSAGSTVAVTSSLQPTGSIYLVDKKGEVDLPLLGRFPAMGISTDSIKEEIQAKAEVYYKMPAVTVRFANLRVSVLGEVNRPGTYILTNEKNTILDALSQANDLTIFGKRENALLVRDSAGHKSFIRFNLNNKDLVKADYFYLQQNDLIYIEPAKGKAASLDMAKSRNYAIAASVISLLIVIATRL